MLTYQDVKNIRLRRAKFGGYKAEDVNKFIDNAKESILKLEKENEDLLCKVKDLIQKNNKYKEEQESVKVTLIKAQKLADKSIEEAKIKANEIVNKAKFDAEQILKNVKLEAEKSLDNKKKEIEDQAKVLSSLKGYVKDFRSNILNLYKEHIKLINSLGIDNKFLEKNSEDINSKDNENDIDKKLEKKEQDFNKVYPVMEKKADDGKQNINEKFLNLKFGENYDLSKDTEESSVGLFSKIQ